MNPPTHGHRLLRDTVVSRAAELGCDHRIVLSRTSGGSRNPLPPDVKLTYVREIVGPANYELATVENPSMIDWLRKLNRIDGYDEVTVVCGSDRVKEYEVLIAKYNGIEFDFTDYVVVSSGQRSGTNTISGTMVRSFVAKHDYRSFIRCYPGIAPLTALRLYSSIELAPAINKPKSRVRINAAGKKKEAGT